MGFGRPRSQRGRPLLAEPEQGKPILDRIVRLSAAYGTQVERSDGRAIIRLEK
jgi:poly-gamma-glutamate synthesis protein (capsule biosynthesis protein)